MNFFGNAKLDFPHPFGKGLLNSGALFPGSFYLHYELLIQSMGAVRSMYMKTSCSLLTEG